MNSFRRVLHLLNVMKDNRKFNCCQQRYPLMLHFATCNKTITLHENGGVTRFAENKISFSKMKRDIYYEKEPSVPSLRITVEYVLE